jgi:cardiolipin synthase
MMAVHELTDHAFSRASGAQLRHGNAVRLLKDASENYQAWLEAIGAARRTVHFEMYIIHGDAQGRAFADALLRKAKEGVAIRLLYDWMGGFGKTPRAFWRHLRAGGVDVRCYNPPRLDQPLGWVSRDHRKTIIVDGTVGFVTGLCVGRMWAGDRSLGRDPWRDTGIELRGPAVADFETAFGEAWAATGAPLPPGTIADPPGAAGDVDVRVVATVPDAGGLFRVDQLVAALARDRLWLTDAYYAGTAPYVEALRAAARDGVDVRLLVPGSSDIPVIRPFSRAGYRPLLDGGVRVFEWNGSMIHAKTAVADGRWARVGSTNLNPASWLGNCELDVIVEDEAFSRQMEAMFRADLENTTEIRLQGNRVRAPHDGAEHRAHAATGSGGRVIGGVLRIANAIGAAIARTRTLDRAEANVALIGAVVVGLIAALAFYYPRGFAYPIGVFSAWCALALLYRSVRLAGETRRPAAGEKAR